jgi:hypothetical protein
MQMMIEPGDPPTGDTPQATVFRWECRCRSRPVLLATYDARGRINIKVRDRYWHIDGQVRTVCPVCGAEHLLDLRELPTSDDRAPDRDTTERSPPRPKLDRR